MDGRDGWAPIAELIERVVDEPRLLATVAEDVRATIREVAGLEPTDIARHTRALLAAATRAVAARRGPTEAELSFVEELAVTRAQQGVPIQAVLGAIHVAERAIWSRARELAAVDGVAPERLLDARELYDDWAEAVRERLIVAHRTTEVERVPPARDRGLELLRRLLDGGSAAAMAAAEAGLGDAEGLWVVATRPPDAARTGPSEAALRSGPADLFAVVDELLVGVVARPPSHDPAAWTVPIGVAGPADAEELAPVRRLAVAARGAAEAVGRTGPVHVSDVATLAVLAGRGDVAGVLVGRCGARLERLGSSAEATARTVAVWLECDRDVAAAAARLYVHPNTVRNRVQRFTEATGVDPHGTFAAVDAWWACRTWLTDRG